MKRRTIHTMLWTASGLLLSLAILFLILTGLHGQIRISDPDGIRTASDKVMSSVQRGDWTSLEAMLSDERSLNPQTGAENSPENMIWKAYQQSLQWRFEEEFEIRSNGVSQTVTVSCLDISAVTKLISQLLLTVPETEDRDQALSEAALQVLQDPLPIMEKKLTLSFLHKEGQWKLVPNNALLALISGFTAA